jgi:tetratricopeptide (TPR) repeat protein
MLNVEYVVAQEGSILGLDSWDRISLNRPEEAIDRFQKAFDLMDKVSAGDPHDSQSRYRELSDGVALAALRAPREPKEALDIYDRCLRRLRETKESDNRLWEEAECLAASSHVLCRLGRSGEARRRLDEASERLARHEKLPGEDVSLNSVASSVLEAKAVFAEDTGDLQTAAEIYQGLLDKTMATRPSAETDLREGSRLSYAYGYLARLYRKIGRPDRAQPLENSRLDLWRDWDRKLPDSSFVHRQLDAAISPAPDSSR